MLGTLTVFLVFFRYSFSTTSMGVIKDAQFIPDESLFQLDNISSIKNQLSCACQCWSNSMCVTATYEATNKICSLFSAQLWQGQLSSIITNKNTTTITFANRNIPGKMLMKRLSKSFYAFICSVWCEYINKWKCRNRAL
jgi:hypothetical protein